MTLQDFARWAMVVLNKGRTFDGQQVVSEAFFEDIVTPNQVLKDAFAQYKFIAPNGSYRSQYWVVDAEEGLFMQNGVHGQLAYYDYPNELAVVMFGTYPIAKDVTMLRSLGVLLEAIYKSAGINEAGVEDNLNLLDGLED